MSRSLVSSRLFFDPTPWITIGLAVILISAACWLPFIPGMTRSISQMKRAAEQIAEGHFEVHVADRRHNEIGQLGAAVNRMAARLAGFVNGQKAFLQRDSARTVHTDRHHSIRAGQLGAAGEPRTERFSGGHS